MLNKIDKLKKQLQFLKLHILFPHSSGDDVND